MKLYALYKLKEHQLNGLDPETSDVNDLKFFIDNLNENGKPIKPIGYCYVELVEEITKRLQFYGFKKSAEWSDFHIYYNVSPKDDAIVLYRIIIDNEIPYLRQNLSTNRYSNIKVYQYNKDSFVIKDQINNRHIYFSNADFIELKEQLSLWKLEEMDVE
jgi:hypothetical protein